MNTTKKAESFTEVIIFVQSAEKWLLLEMRKFAQNVEQKERTEENSRKKSRRQDIRKTSIKDRKFFTESVLKMASAPDVENEKRFQGRRNAVYALKKMLISTEKSAWIDQT